ncbi:MAG: DNA polymerase III subunit delta' [Candidatus Lernaella stagnicola]|nr:DNA polymerase III subunit delta' [Candidatus Lernaella stagnicola]
MSGFADIIGQEKNTDVLRHAMQRGTVAHAYLFAGPAGVGKWTVARVFARALNCLTSDDDACGACRSCLKVREGNHPDIIEVAKSDDSAYYKIGRIRELIRTAQFAPYESKYKIYLIDEAEAMTPEAANALLKTLEEPNAQTVLVLVTAYPHQLLPTIISRCQSLRFGLLSDEQVLRWVIDNMNVDGDDADLIARLAEGSIGRAAQLDLEFLRGPRCALFEELAGARPDHGGDALDLSQKLLEVSPDLLAGIELLAGFLRDAIVWRCTGETGRIRNQDAVEWIASYAARLPATALSDKMRALVQARRLVERNVLKPTIAAALSIDLLSPHPTGFAEGRLPR